ncbi:MAG: HK97 family phage prohead protease [bacterium]
METKAAVLRREVPFTCSLDIYKQAEEAGEFHIVGYAATTDFDQQGDVITAEALKAAADDLLKNSTVLLNHDLKRPIGRVVSVKFDQRGLLIDALISSTEPDVIQKIKEGVLNKFSIRGSVLERERKWDAKQERVVNVIQRLSLIEASLVSVPANPEAKAVGWYTKMALADATTHEGGTDMDPKKEQGAAPMAAAGQGGAAPAAPAPEPAKTTAMPPPEAGKPAMEAPVPAPMAQPAAEPQAELAGMMKMFEKLAGQAFVPLLAKLDQIVSAGDAKVKGMALEAKTMVEAMLSHNAPAMAKQDGAGAAQPDVASVVASEVSKQLKKAIDDIPTLRKGLSPDGDGRKPGADGEEVLKAFEKLDPSQKLRALLSVQHSRSAA